MKHQDINDQNSFDRRNRLHELLIALINKQDDLELMDSEAPSFNSSFTVGNREDPAQWIDRNRRILKRYQDLVRSAMTLDALLESESSGN